MIFIDDDSIARETDEEIDHMMTPKPTNGHFGGQTRQFSTVLAQVDEVRESATGLKERETDSTPNLGKAL